MMKNLLRKIFPFLFKISTCYVHEWPKNPQLEWYTPRWYFPMESYLVWTCIKCGYRTMNNPKSEVVKMYRLGRRQKRALLTADGHEVVVFKKGQEKMAEKVCRLLNDVESDLLYKHQVIRIVAEFARSYNTEKMFDEDETLPQAIERVRDHIKWDA